MISGLYGGSCLATSQHLNILVSSLSTLYRLPCLLLHTLAVLSSAWLQFNARPNAVEQVLTAFKHALAKQGWKGAAAAADRSEL